MNKRNSELAVNLLSPDESGERFMIYDGIEFKCAPYKFMFEVPFFRCSKSIHYLHIKSQDWSTFKTELQGLPATTIPECTKSALLVVILPEKLKGIETTAQTERDEVFRINKALKERYGEAFFFTTLFQDSVYQAHMILCDGAPTKEDYFPEYHRATGEPYDFFEICHHCQSPCKILHFRFEFPRNEINKGKLSGLIHDSIDKSYLADPSVLPLLQPGLPDLTADEGRILFEGFDNKKFSRGMGVSITEDVIEANIYLIFNPSKDEQ